MTDVVEEAARAAAARLAGSDAPSLPGDVEVALRARTASQQPDQYFDPISLGALIVSAATLAWTIYQDRRGEAAPPAPEVMTRSVRVQLESPPDVDPATRDRVIAVTVEETLRAADPG